MEFIDSLLELSEEIGWEPVQIFFFCAWFPVFLWEFIPWSLSWILKGLACFFRWLRFRKKKAADQRPPS